MEFAAEHLPSALRSLQIPTIWVADGDVRLGNAALEQLGVLSLRGESDRQCLLGILDHCRSVAGRRLLRTRVWGRQHPMWQHELKRLCDLFMT
jgi:hypothetical protein